MDRAAEEEAEQALRKLLVCGGKERVERTKGLARRIRGLAQAAGLDCAAQIETCRRYESHFSAGHRKNIRRSLFIAEIYFAARLKCTGKWRIDEHQRRATFEHHEEFGKTLRGCRRRFVPVY